MSITFALTVLATGVSTVALYKERTISATACVFICVALLVLSSGVVR